MKKLAVAMMAGLILISGAACSKGSSWSEADKAQLETGMAAAKALGVLTEKQADCTSDWMQDRYDSWAAAEADDGNVDAAKDLAAKCGIDPKLVDGGREEPAVTTTTVYTRSLCSIATEELSEFVDDRSNFYGNDWRTEMDRLMRAKQSACAS